MIIVLLCGELWKDIDHRINVDELNPGLQILGVVVPDECRLLCPPKECASALIVLLDQDITTCDSKARLEYTELPALKRVTVALHCFRMNIEFEARPVEAYRLSDSLDVGLF